MLPFEDSCTDSSSSRKNLICFSSSSKSSDSKIVILNIFEVKRPQSLETVTSISPLVVAVNLGELLVKFPQS